MSHNLIEFDERRSLMDTSQEAEDATAAYDDTVVIAGYAALMGIRRGCWDLYAVAFQRLQVEARTALAAALHAGGAR